MLYFYVPNLNSRVPISSGQVGIPQPAEHHKRITFFAKTLTIYVEQDFLVHEFLTSNLKSEKRATLSTGPGHPLCCRVQR